ncbi:MAG: response regulator [Pirellulaceae bacterium]|nr:response regulator [Pirellulaceae bacterium]
MNQEAAVFLVDDDDGVRQSLEFILANVGEPVVSFSSPADLLANYDVDRPGCLVLDLKLPQMDGLELWSELRKRGGYHPCIIITGHGTVSDAVEAFRSGAVDFLEKPFHHEVLVERVRAALEYDKEQRASRLRHDALQSKLSQLTPRERQVLDLVLDGKLSKQIARELNITTKTVEVHRSNVTRKMEVGSVAQLFKQMNDHLSKLTDLTSVRNVDRHDTPR